MAWIVGVVVERNVALGWWREAGVVRFNDDLHHYSASAADVITLVTGIVNSPTVHGD
jgi:hypothetical protein